MIKSWMVIGLVAFLVAFTGTIIPTESRQWFFRLQRPQWLTFERLIPFIWMFIFICGTWSAIIVWESLPGTRYTWVLMGLYLLVEVAIMAYTSVMCQLRSLKVGTVIGATGTILGAFLTLCVWPISQWAGVLLLPYLLWSPVGTYTTWVMVFLNPDDA